MGKGLLDKPVILVVDDTEADLDVLLEALPDAYEVVAAMDGQTALRVARESGPDLILLDVMMPEMDGYEVCRRLKADPLSADIPVVFITSMRNAADETRGFGLGAVDYITKPISPPVLLARLRTHLALRQAYLDLAWQHQELEKLARLREEVERMTRHDLKTPLTAVLNVPDLLLEELALSPDQREMLQMLKQSGFRMLQIINSSLDLYKMETGRYRYRPAPVNLAPLLDQILRELGDLMVVKSLKPRLLLEGRPLAQSHRFLVSGEETVLYTMLANLLKNAVEASPPDQEITVRLTSGDQAVIEIHNQGCVPRELRTCFFDKFTTAGKTGGTGLGTYTARLIARTLGGTIDFTTSDEDGTSLIVKLIPAQDHSPSDHWQATAGAGQASAQAPPQISGQTSNQGGRAESVLVVDDYPSMRCLTHSILRRLGFGSVQEASDGKEALAIIDSQPVDLIIADLHMPKMSGLDLLKAVREDPRTKAIPFVIISGDSDKRVIDQAIGAEVSDYLLKPFSPDTLKASIERILPHPSTELFVE